MSAHKQNGTDKLEQASTLTFHISQLSLWDKTHSVVSKLTRRGVNCSFLAPGGFKVELVVDVAHIKTRLREEKKQQLFIIFKQP